MLTEHRFHTGAVTLNYAEGEASGPPLVLLHGGSVRWQSALPLIPELTGHWHIYAPDLRGHGKSGYVPGAYHLQEYVADIATFLKQVVKEPAVLFGHSLGGHIAIMAAAWYPHLVRALIIGDAPFDRAKLSMALQDAHPRLRFWQELAGPRHSPEEIAEALKRTPISMEGQPDLVPSSFLYGDEHPWYRQMAEHLHHNDPDMLAAVIEFEQMHKGYDFEQLFPMISCPVLIIQGSLAHGGMLTNEEIEHALALLSSATVARMETVGHPLHTQEKEPVLLALKAFLNKL
jgi:pimeloyl-ACP methyl ester carboxylesterase